MILEGGEAEICDDIFDGGEGKQEDDGRSTYEFSLDPETRAAEKKIRRVVAKQVIHQQTFEKNQ